ncbi:1-deoxy-D-xylulose-5-phosphate synthase [Dethiobacter alkaliphilus]|uniref:1-deoxy-D-xylulose-5-phosphate synthase n=1 Tax=Dethiobacter alkaliphilus TaxID=427926 RepID=UPI002227F7C5|nr:1-deoxy-D-xylulose-5-phosphate synthase [Dethiobacter alkaliphilus]MCW3490259.1 1-deoxy-D-xylulose-5-phosphate synthase [Dethiobacter alkaliphilus]
MDEYLKKISGPEDLKKLSTKDLKELACEIRSFLLEKVSQTGGHLAPNLGVVELSIALHTIYDSPRDKIIWDVGHQSYVHKILTGRHDRFDSLRQHGGLSGFPKTSESEHDVFQTGHSSTSISAALGMAQARDLLGEKHHVIAVIGDGSMTGGMAFEALNHAGDTGTDLTVILNDNEMSIAQNVGGLAAYLGRLRTDPKYFRLKEDVELIVKRIPHIGGKVLSSVDRVKDAVKSLIVPGMLFEELGFTYLGPVNGHQVEPLLGVLRGAKKIKGPVLIHVLTKKGKGFEEAECKPDVYHGIGPFNPESPPVGSKQNKVPTYTEIVSKTLVNAAKKNDKVVAITAAMASGTGLDCFEKEFPRRFFDVGIAEQHAVTFAAGLAKRGFHPVAAIYSTFLQRAYDQVLHDVCIQNLPVLFALDRAGIVGEDGETHNGLFDLSYLRHMPNMTVIVPRDEDMLQHALTTGLKHQGPVAIRYPRGKGEGVKLKKPKALSWGRGEEIRQGRDLQILAVGPFVYTALAAAEKLEKRGLSVGVIDPVFVKPLDAELITRAAMSARYGLVTLEEHVLAGGFGSAVLEFLEGNGITEVPVKRLGIPDRFVEQGKRDTLLEELRLTPEHIAAVCLEMTGAREQEMPWVQSVSE